MKSKMLKHIAAVLLLMAMTVPVFGQATAPAQPLPSFMDTHQTDILIGLFALVMFIMLFVVFYLSSMLVSMTKSTMTPEQQELLREVEFIPFAKFVDWTSISKTLNDSVPLEHEADIMLDHDYDGIKELDNHLPPWWTAMFYMTIVFAFVYFFYFQLSGTDRSQFAEYEQDMAIAQEQKDAYLAKMANLVNENNVTQLADAGSLGNGKEIYTTYCAACHGQSGEGGVGPNFTDKFWIHGGSIKNLFTTIKYGVPAKGMISWKDQMGAKDMQDVASYILTMQGTNPANPKEAQGTLWEETGVSDTTAIAPLDSIPAIAVDSTVQE
jgi:cytochrome c oxidase cbb3-type subunit III